jgi:hypothetical protein
MQGLRVSREWNECIFLLNFEHGKSTFADHVCGLNVIASHFAAKSSRYINALKFGHIINK